MAANSDLLQAALIGYQAELARIEHAIADIRGELGGPTGTLRFGAQARQTKDVGRWTPENRCRGQERWAEYNPQKAAKA